MTPSPFERPTDPHYRKITAPNGITYEHYGQVEIVPGIVGPKTIILTGTLEALNAQKTRRRSK